MFTSSTSCPRQLCASTLLIVFAVVAAATPISLAQNIVLFVADDHGTDAGCYGNEVIQTPNMDALARAGVVFDRAFCTTASCSASRSVILTGLHNHLNGQYGHVHAYHKFTTFVNVVSLPTYLEAAGYRTARSGKFHVAPESVYQFQHVLPGGGRKPVAQAENCREFLAAADPRPFFLYFCTSDPHRGGEVGESDPTRPNRFGNAADDSPPAYAADEVLVPDFLPDTPASRAEIAQYYESVERVDRALGNLVELLRASDHWDDTLIMYISDHGMAMPGAKTNVYEPGLRSPCIVRDPTSTETGVRSDAMVSWVDVVPTLLNFAEVLNEDEGNVREEVLAKVHQEVKKRTGLRHRNVKPGKFHGRSFLPAVRGEPFESSPVYASHTFHEIQMYYPMRVVREDRYKLIWNIAHPLAFPFASDLWAASTWQAQYRQGPDAPFGPRTIERYIHRPEFELYDLENDPLEARNLADAPNHAVTLRRMKVALREFQRRTSDPWIMKWDYE